MFWPAAFAAAVCVLAGSVKAGVLIGKALLAQGVGVRSVQPAATAATPPEVVGGQPHAAVVPGQSVAIWPKEDRPAN